ncbi:DUF4037 domain-containing protein [Streptosporangium sp. KLBMP 9127]|nr:DUF4037 domain-containing protein [Streptosporangium sp. KLBMP 9127]
MMSGFVPGLQLSRDFYLQVVSPALSGVPHSAALIGPGSEVLACDTERSTDHDWGPRVVLFVGDGVARRAERAVAERLPPTFNGYPTVFGSDVHPVRHGVRVERVSDWFTDRLGFDPAGGVSTLDWLAAPWQRLAEVTGGEVFHDGLGLLESARRELRWYPTDVWRYVLACQWRRVAQEEAFPGRCGEVGDDLGSALLSARLARELVRLVLLMRRRYPPYAKWAGTAFARLTGAAELGESLSLAVSASGWRVREQHLSRVYERVAALHNRLGLTEPLETGVRPFHERPFMVIDAQRFSDALTGGISDPVLRGLPPIGCADQFSDNTDLLTDPARCRAAVGAVLGLS